MTDARQLPIFTDCPYGGCEDGYCACLEQDLDEDYDDYEDAEEIGIGELADLYGLDADELDGLDYAQLEELLNGLISGRSMILRGRLRRVETTASIDTYTPEGAL